MAAANSVGVAVSAVRYRVAGLGPDLTASEHLSLRRPASSLEPVDRRRFLINLGGTTASINSRGSCRCPRLRNFIGACLSMPRRKCRFPDRSGDVDRLQEPAGIHASCGPLPHRH